jgi:hypothetical protein
MTIPETEISLPAIMFEIKRQLTKREPKIINGVENWVFGGGVFNYESSSLKQWGY